MIEPTQGQIKEFWEKYGLHYTIPYWVDSNKNLAFYGEAYSELLKSINLNNLFKYAVPLAIDGIMSEQECSSDVAYEILFKKWLWELQLNIPYVALALFWVLKEVSNAEALAEYVSRTLELEDEYDFADYN